MHQIPLEGAADTFHRWAQKYGDVLYLAIPGRPMTRPDYSDRPYLPLINMYGWKSSTPTLPYGKELAKHRRMHNAYLSKQKCASQEYKEMQTEQAEELVGNLLRAQPGDHDICLSRFATGLITQIIAGHKIVSDDDAFLHISHLIQESAIAVGRPGASVIDFMPFLRHLPRWLPGMATARTADEWRPVIDGIHDTLLRSVREKRDAGDISPSYILTYLEEMEARNEKKSSLSSEDEEILKGSAGSMFTAGELTNKAQEELDRVVGRDRAPTFEDRSQLPYVECVLQEVFRWAPPVPLGLPHSLRQDDVYRDMHIPAGTLVFANIKGMTRETSVYSNAGKFIPERFLSPLAEPHFPAKFGFGRRVCTGQHFAENSVWIAKTLILAKLHHPVCCR
ncbi:Cytochrome P450 [Mycena kentingensis (nom. inval.)]|nr:Cytochrome P450 [Mycena kentingensis (nom. inval.)]